MRKSVTSILILGALLVSLLPIKHANAASLKLTDFFNANYVWVKKNNEVFLQTRVGGRTYDLRRAYKNPEKGNGFNTNYVFSEEILTYMTETLTASFDNLSTQHQSNIVRRETRIAITFEKASDDRGRGSLFFADYHDAHDGWDSLIAVGSFSNTTSQVKDPDHVAPGKMEKITSGKLAGELIPIGEWKTPVEDVFEDNHSTVWLEDAGGTYLKTNEEIQKSKDGKHYFYEIDFSEITDGGLYPDSKYSVRIRQQDNWSNCTGNTEKGSGFCRNTWTATTSFTFDKNGKVDILNTDPRAGKDGINISNMTWENGINLTVKETLSSPLSEALAQAIKWLSDIITNWTERLAGWIETALNEANLEDTKEAWEQVRTISVSLLLLGLLIIAFANVLSLDIEQYGAQRMIPRFVINIVLTYFSFLIISILLEAAKVLQSEFKNILQGLAATDQVAIPFHVNLDNLSASDIVGQLGTILFLFFMLLAVVGALLYLFLVLLARVVIIKFLLVAAPVALILGIMPFTESLLKRWWSELFRWIFMGPAVMGVLLVGAILLKNAPAGGAIDLNAVNDNSLVAFRQIFYVATAAVTYFFAASIPTQMGGKIMAAWSKRVRGAMRGGATRIPGVRETGQFFAQRGKAKEQRIAERGAKARAWVGQKGFLGRQAAGYTKLEAQTAAKRMHMAQVADRKKEMEYLSDDELKTYLDSKDVKMQQAAFGVLASRERLEGSPIKDKKRNEEFFKQQALISKFGEGFYEDPNIKSEVFKNNLAAGLHNETLQPIALKIAKAKKAADLKAGEIEALASFEGGRELLGSFRTEDIRAIKQRGSRGSRESLEKPEIVRRLSPEARTELFGEEAPPDRPTQEDIANPDAHLPEDDQSD